MGVNFKNKPVLVLGAGKSGIATSCFLAGKGAAVVLADMKPEDAFDNGLDDLHQLGVKTVFGSYPEITPDLYQLVVASPGVPLTVPPVVKAKALGIPVTGELELAWRFTRSPVVAITGTNGKTTTTALLGEMFKHAGRKTLVAGNIGTPLVDLVENYGPEDIIVAEVSSFQLETTSSFQPRVGAVLNLTPDHLDRHGTMENYTAAKTKIFEYQRPSDFTVLNYDHSLTANLGHKSPGQVIFFSRQHILKKGVFVYRGEIVARLFDDQMQVILPVSEVAIPGAHNLENALAAVACALAIGLEATVAAESLQMFAGVPHRLEFAGEINGVRYINDSKGTNPEASIKALEAFDDPIILIAGGRNKGSDFTSLARKIKEKVKAVIVLGESAGELARAARENGCGRVLRIKELREAVLLAHQEARPGEIVLLSPACASWDMFSSYEERGNLFKQVVQDLGG